MKKNQELFPFFDRVIPQHEKEKLLKQKAKVIWFTGLSGSGKTTTAVELEKKLHKNGYLCKILDGDNVRVGINNNLGFSKGERLENIRRIAEISLLFVRCGVISINAFVSPSEEMRELAQKIIGKEYFIEIFVDTPIEICEERDIKGLYKKARLGEIKNFTGISAPFETPKSANLVLKTENRTVTETVDEVFDFVLPFVEF